MKEQGCFLSNMKASAVDVEYLVFLQNIVRWPSTQDRQQRPCFPTQIKSRHSGFLILSFWSPDMDFTLKVYLHKKYYIIRKTYDERNDF